jgi:hypothetical protein
MQKIHKVETLKVLQHAHSGEHAANHLFAVTIFIDL